MSQSWRATSLRVTAYLLGAAIVLLLPPLLLQRPLSIADRIVKVYALLGAVSFICAGVWFLLRPSRSAAGEPRDHWLKDLVACIAAFAPLSVLILIAAPTPERLPGLPRPVAPHAILVATIMLGIVLLFAVRRASRVGVALLGALVIVAGAGAAAQLRLAHLSAKRIPFVKVTRINTSLYPLRVTFYESAFKRLSSRGGTLAKLGNDLLLLTADGDFYRIEHPETDKPLKVHALPFHTPMNRDAFAADTAKDGLDVGVRRFRTGGMLVQERDGHLRIFTLYHVWHPDGACTTMRLASIEGPEAQLLANPAPDWKIWFETSPCLKIQRKKEIYFGGVSIGGRIVQPSDHEILFSIGDHEFEGTGGSALLAQEMDKTYGKTFLLDVNTGAWRIFTVGNRNPEGLYIDSSQRIWETEHGPQGGDELNLLQDGKNYGWPLVTYGVDYGTHAWPVNKTNGRHPGFEGPRFAWVPSIATAGISGVDGKLFADWDGDLLVTALNGKAIWRVRVVDDNRVTVTEPIPLAHRTRDIIEDQDGRLVFWTDEGALGVIEPESQPTTPASIFAWRCSGCHTVADGTQHHLGPDLYGVVGRHIGGARGFGYSQALQSKNGSWSEASLDAFLTDPQKFAPGTAMAAPGIPDQKERAKIIRYLKAPGQEN